jgi:hypothetical protein
LRRRKPLRSGSALAFDRAQAPQALGCREAGIAVIIGGIVLAIILH